MCWYLRRWLVVLTTAQLACPTNDGCTCSSAVN